MLTDSDIRILRHSLGIQYADHKPYREYYCAGAEDVPQLDRLVDKGLMTKAAPKDWLCGQIYYVTELGKQVAMEDIPKRTLAQLRYLRFLDIKDCYSDLTFKEFLTDPYYKEARNKPTDGANL